MTCVQPLPSHTMHKSMTQRLDDNVITLSMLGTVSSAQRSQNGSRGSLSEIENKWCCVLDELSWLCDYRTGGKSVTSVAAQVTTTGLVFWFANNRGPQPLVKRHLKWILQELRSMAVNDQGGSKETLWRLFRKSLVFSRRRVESYWAKLYSLLEHVASSTEKQKGMFYGDSLPSQYH